jgi:hypothetical protein
MKTVQVSCFRWLRFNRQYVRSFRMDMRTHDNRLRVSTPISDHSSTSSLTLARNAINALSFSHDGEYLAIANAGTYIDIVRFFQPDFTALLTYNLSVRNRNRCSPAPSSRNSPVTDSGMASLQIRHRVLRTDQNPRRGPASCSRTECIRIDRINLMKFSTVG